MSKAREEVVQRAKDRLRSAPNIAERKNQIVDDLIRELGQIGRGNPLDDLLSTHEVAKMYGITERRVREKVTRLNRQKGVGKQIGRTWILHKKELIHFESDKSKAGRPKGRKRKR